MVTLRTIFSPRKFLSSVSVFTSWSYLHADPVIPDINLQQPRLGVFLNVDVDGKVGVDVAHLVLVALGHANDEIVDNSLDGSEGRDIFPGAMV